MRNTTANIPADRRELQDQKNMNKTSKVEMTELDFTEMLQAIVDNDRKCLTEGSSEEGTVQVPAIAFWTTLFSKFFLHCNSSHHDDMIFFVKKDPKEHKDKPEIKVFRVMSDNMPGLGDPCYDWSETVYLNMILQQVEYKLTCAICKKNEDDQLEILNIVTQKVYASPTQHNMESKSTSSEIAYPNIFFMIDSFDEVWTDLYLSSGEMVCVEIVAHNKLNDFQSVIFLGSVGYQSLLNVFDKKKSAATSWVEKMSLGLFRAQTDLSKQFVRMKGPGGKGYAEMAVEKSELPNQSIGIVAKSIFPKSKSDPSSLYSHTQDECDKENTSTSTGELNHANNALLRTHLTFVTLPWHKITLDILRDYETPSEKKEPVLQN